jgi:pimeloyl-ACP methyl ester carboxylesterase
LFAHDNFPYTDYLGYFTSQVVSKLTNLYKHNKLLFSNYKGFVLTKLKVEIYMLNKITRHMVTMKDHRQVHYRRAGSGSPVILLHQSPNSSQEYIGLISDLAEEYTVFAPDTPGNGLSDPLPLGAPSMTDYADNVAQLMDNLGIGACPVYGFHTGAVCTLEFAWRYPEKVTVAVVNGYVNMPEDLVNDIKKNYFVPLELNWSGSHLTWTWARFREQTIFFPWYRSDSASRMQYNVSSASQIHSAMIEFLRSGVEYRKPYRAAFTQDSVKSVQEMAANCVIMSPKTDVLYPGLDRMPTPSSSVTVYRPDTADEATDILKRKFKENKSQKAAPDIAATQPIMGQLWGQYLEIGGGSIYCRRNTDATGRPVLFIHGSSGSSLSMDRYMAPFIGKRPVLCIDLPGYGESDNPMGSDVSVEKQASFIAEAIHALDYDTVDVFGNWGGGTVAIQLSYQYPALVSNIAIPNMIYSDLKGDKLDKMLNKYAPDIKFDDFGAHWVYVWNMLRDKQLFNPWYDRKEKNILQDGEPDIEASILHQNTLDFFKSFPLYKMAYRAYFSYPILDRLAGLSSRVMVGNTPAEVSKKIEAGGLKNCRVADMSRDHNNLAKELLGFFAT